MATYYVATTGNDITGNGSILTPWKSWQKGFETLSADDTLYIRGGTYTDYQGTGDGGDYGVEIGIVGGPGVNGTAGSHITVSAYPNEVPILDGSGLTSTLRSNIGLRLNQCSYWDITGLTFINFKQYSDNDFASEGVYLDGCSNLTFSECTVHDCGDGFYMYTHGCDEIHFYDCDSYDNEDRYTGDNVPGFDYQGGLANGFYGAPQTGDVVSFTRCRAWSNSDDGWDMFGGGGFVTWTDCWAFSNGDGSGPQGYVGDGIGFKLGPVKSEGANQRVLYNCLSFDNIGQGYDANQDNGAPYSYIAMNLYNCVGYHNGKNFMFWWPSATVIMNCISYAETGDPDEFGAGTTETTNSWTEATVTDGDFLSVDSTAKGAREATGTRVTAFTTFNLLPVDDLLLLVLISFFGMAWSLWLMNRAIGAYEFLAANIPVTAVTVTGTGGASTISTDDGTLQMLATILPDNATDQTVTWSVINGTGAASITASGLLTAVSNGTVTVKATANG